MLHAKDGMVRQHLASVERLLLAVCEDDELPWFITDRATVLDFSSEDESDIVERIAAVYGVRVDEEDVGIPVWKLAAKIDSMVEQSG